MSSLIAATTLFLGSHALLSSYLPFVAIVQGRNRLVWRELPWLAMAVGVAAFGVAAALHARVVGVPAF